MTRDAAAGSLRRLGHALVAHEVGEEGLATLARRAAEMAAEVESSPRRARAIDRLKRDAFREMPEEDGPLPQHFPDCVVSGKDNPMGIAIEVRREGDDAVASVRLGAAFEGAPGRSHGGVVAAVFDDTMGYVIGMISAPAYTGSLTVRYLAPTPVGELLEFRARLVRRDGRKLHIEAEARHGATRVAEAEAVFITIPADRYGLLE